jgi:peptide chain release factor 3
MLEHAGEEFQPDLILEGKQTPVFFGSAANNFGVQLLLDGFLDYATPPMPRQSLSGTVNPDDKPFSGFIFKIQANMDPKHRDRIAFMRICSGKFTRDMQAFHATSGKKIRLSNSQKLFGQERETVDEAYAGDIIGFVGNSNFGIGDTITEDQKIVFKEIPKFAPEHFVLLQNPNPSNYKKFRDGLDQLLQEGVIQAYYLKNSAQKTPLLGAVGPLQFEVVQYRLQDEYGAESRMEQTSWKVLRWVSPENTDVEISSVVLPAGAAFAYDSEERLVLLLTSDWSLNYFMEKHPKIRLSDIPFSAELVSK